VPVIDAIIGADMGIDDSGAIDTAADIEAVGMESSSESPQALNVRAVAMIPAPMIPE